MLTHRLPVGGFDRTVHDQYISIVYPCIDHGASGYLYKKGRGGMFDEVFVQIQVAFYVVFRR